MGETAFAQLGDVHIYFLDVDFYVLGFKVYNVEGLTRPYVCDLPIVKINDLLRVFYNRRSVAGDEIFCFVFAHSDN